MSEHTKGEWRVRPDGCAWRAVNDSRGSSAYECVLAEDQVVALVVAHNPDPWGDAPPTKHNARLIAAAPTMYEYIASSASNGCAEARKIMETINAGL